MSLRTLLDGPPLAPARPLDRGLRWWAQQPPRMRLVMCLLVVVLVGAVAANRWADVQARWGGEGVVAWQAVRTVAAGEDVSRAVARVRLPPVAVPPSAVTERPDRGDLAVMPVFEGTVLVEGHLAVAAIAQHLDADHRLVPVPVDATWGVRPGVTVDVWVTQPQPQLLAERLAVQAVDGRSRLVALVVVPAAVIPQLTTALEEDAVRLAIAGAG